MTKISRRRRRAGTAIVLVLGGSLVALGLAAPSSQAVTGARGTRATKHATPAADAAVTEPATTSAPPYAVGVTTVTLVDPTRPTAARGSTPASTSRAFNVTIRYPTTGTAGSPDAVNAAPVSGTFPLVVFAHGYDVSAATYADLERQIAAAGFVVAAPDFPLSSSAYAGDAVRDEVDQAGDVSFVIAMLRNITTTPALLAGTIADAKVAVIGHSDGGITAAGVAYNSTAADPAVGAAVILSGAEAAFSGTWGGSVPLLAVHGDADEVNPYASSEQLFADASGPKWLVTVDGGSHLGPFTTDPVRSTIGVLITDFLRAELSGDNPAAARIAGDANVPGALTLAASG